MRKKIAVIGIILSLLLLAACGKKAEETVKQDTVESLVETAESKEETPDAAAENTAESETEASIEGMVVDAAMNSLSIMTLAGEVQIFAYPESGLKSELKEGILLGDTIEVIYTGSQTEGNAVAVSVKEGSIETSMTREVYEFAVGAAACAKYNDMEGMSELAEYPVQIKLPDNQIVTVKNKEDFLKMDRETFLPLAELMDYNLFNMTESQAGYVMGNEKLNITFQKTDNGYGITEINIES